MNILLCGGTDGIGLALLKLLLANSQKINRIYVLGRNFHKVISLCMPVALIPCDITIAEDLDMLKRIDLPTIHIFVNCIGTFIKAPSDQLSDEQIEQHFHLNAIANIQLTNLVLKRLAIDGTILVCNSAVSALEPKAGYGLQTATKMAYKSYLDCLRKEKPEYRIMVVMPAGISTNIFRKGNDLRDTTKYAEPEQLASIMKFLLELPDNLVVTEMVIENCVVNQKN